MKIRPFHAPGIEHGRARSVLLVDNASVLPGLSRLIAGEAPRLRLAGATECAVQALGIAAAERPDVIVADVFRPGRDGYAALAQLLLAGRPVVVLTCSDDEETRALALGAGAFSLVSKLAPAGELLAAIDAAGF
ncbi:MAG: response regulator [Rhodocyclaceae bacterium]|nr:response regulator [Rhodocyclaceae bacterium]